MTDHPVQLRLLGRLTLWKQGVDIPLPSSRKVRGLLALLAVTSGPLPRSRVCDLLCDSSSDPRGELRWCLSKLRAVLDGSSKQRVDAAGDAVALDLSDCYVDTKQIALIREPGLETLNVSQLRELSDLYSGDFAAGLELDRNPEFASWLSAQRRRFRADHVAVLEQLVVRYGEEYQSEAFASLEKWLQLAPFDRRAHELLLQRLLQAGRIKEGEAHLEATIRLFEAEGVDWMSIRECWRAARQKRMQEGPEVVQLSSPPPVETKPETPSIAGSFGPRRASICVMPFSDRSLEPGARGGLADWLTEDIITRLAKLRVLFVIARGSVFSLCERNVPPEEAARLLKVDYVASGSVRRYQGRLNVTAQLAEAATGRIVWADDFSYSLDAAFDVLDEIGNRIVISLAGQIETAERNRAVLKPPSSLDAWEAYHRGLWHMYRFNAEDNRHAAHFFQLAVKQDRTFARAHAGLSFTHFQNVFLHWSAERDREIERAYAAAADSIVADDLDPAAHWAMGRALWLRGHVDDSVLELQRSVGLSPNFALGHYTLGFVQSQEGDAQSAIESSDISRQLSPFDPLMFAMLASRAIALFRLQRYEEAADWASKAAVRPNAHVNVQAVAVNCLAAAGRLDEARAQVVVLRRAAPDYGIDDFFRAFRFPAETRESFRRSAAKVGL
ncbi:MAG TPA: BTAD domain-containing putative transcriptional regulator [Steroidobacter sp.]|uniref:BTAD domain-containing putative transcriptional regulator n=1 Tax=Steroidobacter sp. TaxID=1978227 RepID=UPI002ED96D3F